MLFTSIFQTLIVTFALYEAIASDISTESECKAFGLSWVDGEVLVSDEGMITKYDSKGSSCADYIGTSRRQAFTTEAERRRRQSISVANLKHKESTRERRGDDYECYGDGKCGAGRYCKYDSKGSSCADIDYIGTSRRQAFTTKAKRRRQSLSVANLKHKESTRRDDYEC
eukprot:Awhi_evm1s13277